MGKRPGRREREPAPFIVFGLVIVGLQVGAAAQTQKRVVVIIKKVRKLFTLRRATGFAGQVSLEEERDARNRQT